MPEKIETPNVRTLEGAKLLQAQSEAASALIEVEVSEERLKSNKALASPHMLYGARVWHDGFQWVATFGREHEVCGRGDSPAEACADFDRQWIGKE